MRTPGLKRVLFYLFAALCAVFLLSVMASIIFGISITGLKSGKIGLIKVEGIIVSSGSFIEQLKTFKEQDTIRALVVRIDSPGGSVAPSQEIYRELVKFKQETGKKIVASMASTAASGGYYIACAADKIVANPGTLTGSIGVIVTFPNLGRLFDKVGYEEQIVKSGRFKDIGSASRELTEEERTILQRVVDDIHEQFIEAVSTSRNIEKENITTLADGRVFSGRQAMEFNLVDSLGTLEDAVELASELAGISGEPKVVTVKKERSIFDIARDLVGQVSSFKPFEYSPIKVQYILP
ncbi:MAG: signal peptide peptidase SppA [bacterium]